MERLIKTVGGDTAHGPVSRRKVLLAEIVILSVAALWGSNFVFIKIAVERVSAVMGGAVIAASILFLMMRYVTATGILAIVRPQSWLRATRRDWLMGGFLGVCYVAAISLQVIGIHGTTPGISGFIISLSTAMVPFLYWAVAKRSPGRWQIVGAIVATCGLSLLSLRGGLKMSWGEGVTLLSAIFYAVHILVTGLFASKVRPATLAFTQIAVAASIFVLASLAWVQTIFHLPLVVWAIAVWTALTSSVYGIVAKNWAQQYLSSTHAGIILSFEAVFAAIAGIISGFDTVTWQLLAGGSLLMTGVFIVELLPSPGAERKPKGEAPLG